MKHGDRVKINEYEGVLMPSDDKYISIKLDNGYNIGLKNQNLKIKLIKKKETKEIEIKEVKEKKGLKKISILHTGGTIASKVDYETGGVVAKFNPEEIVEMFPELKEIANISSKLLFQISSEDMRIKHWQKIAKAIAKEETDGIIVTHGTDTMHYTSAALSFMLENIDKPVILVGAQRSSDRPSSDGALNLLAAAKFISNTNFKGVGICMHAGSDDDLCVIIPGTKAKKLHTSRRDAFQTINDEPIAIIGKDFIDIRETEYNEGKFIVKEKMEEVGIIKARPGITKKEIEFYGKNFKGIVIEGTGLGHISSTSDEENEKILEEIRKITKKIPVVMTSQCVYGRINMNVYSPGRKLLEAGVIPADMTTECAYVKLAWLLGNYGNADKMNEDLRGEMTPRILE